MRLPPGERYSVPGRDENSLWARMERWFGAYPSRTFVVILAAGLLFAGVPGAIAGYQLAGKLDAAAACKR